MIVYFGPIRQPGHYFWIRQRERSIKTENPWKYAVDGKLQPEGKETEGLAKLHHKDGWTALAFWDRTVDTRPGSCSTYLSDTIMTFDEIVAASKAAFPDRWNQMKFEVRLAP